MENDQQERTTSRGIGLFVLSFLSLYLELLLIRWLAADIRAFSVFKTFPLATCFVGLGAGYALNSSAPFARVSQALLACVVMMGLADALPICYWEFPAIYDLNSAGDVSQWLPNLLLFAGTVILLLASPFALCLCIGSKLGEYFSELTPIKAYCINILGAIAGSIVFSILAFCCLPIWILLIPVAAVFTYYGMSDGKKIGIGALLSTLAVAASMWIPPPIFPGTVTYLSPYQRLDLAPLYAEVGKKEPLGYRLFANRAFHQAVVDLSPAQIARIPSRAPELQDLLTYYSLPYKLVSPPGDVLVVGAGMGADLQEALKYNPKHIDAVEIDPLIIKLGVEKNISRPYEDPRVTSINDDARHFFNTCNKKYDLIVFGLIDSHTTSSTQSASVRLDNFVYTRESITRALQLLKPTGLMIMCFGSNPFDWIPIRLKQTIKAATGYEPILLHNSRPNAAAQHTIYIVGKAVQDKTFVLPSNVSPLIPYFMPDKSERIITDDWPHLYLASKPVDLGYLLILAIVLLLGFAAARQALFASLNWSMWQLFFLGAAFLLLELQSIARLALIYGSTWLTSSIVITCVLIMLLFANLIVLKWPEKLARGIDLVYIALFLSLFASYFLPVGEALSLSSGFVGQAFVTIVTVLPMFLAGLIFGTAFSQQSQSGRAMAFNLFGAVIGAIVEYLSNYLGVNSLVLVAAVLYLGSYFALRARRKTLTCASTISH